MNGVSWAGGEYGKSWKEQLAELKILNDRFKPTEEQITAHKERERLKEERRKNARDTFNGLNKRQQDALRDYLYI